MHNVLVVINNYLDKHKQNNPWWILIQFSHLIIVQHWQVPLSKRFRALKLWFVLRNYGISGLQNMIRENVRLAGKFEALVRSDTRFEIPASRHLGMVVFRLKGDCAMTEKLLKKLNSRLEPNNNVYSTSRRPAGVAE